MRIKHLKHNQRKILRLRIQRQSWYSLRTPAGDDRGARLDDSRRLRRLGNSRMPAMIDIPFVKSQNTTAKCTKYLKLLSELPLPNTKRYPNN